jgi:crossover junction endodeoxyribonuclease RuvC
LEQTVLGIDPGLTRCGFGLIQVNKGRRISFIEVGVLQSESGMELSDRIAKIGNGLEDLLKRTKPTQVAIERVFSQHNLNTVMGVAQITGVLMFLCSKHNIPVDFYTPTEVKAAVTGSGRANKDQVTEMVTKLLKLKAIPKPADAADALAIAITGAWRGTKSTTGTETPAQRKWRTAEASSKRQSK